MDETDKMSVAIPLEVFEHEARDFNQHNLQDFLKSSTFNQQFAIEGKKIISLVTF